MYAIISDGNHQYRVEEGQEVVVSYRDVPAGEKFKFESVLAVGGDGDAKLGSPLVAGASVAAEVIDPEKGEKDGRLHESQRSFALGIHIRKITPRSGKGPRIPKSVDLTQFLLVRASTPPGRPMRSKDAAAPPNSTPLRLRGVAFL